MREFNVRSRPFLLGDHFINSHNLSLDIVWILLGENWFWSLLGLKGLRFNDSIQLKMQIHVWWPIAITRNLPKILQKPSKINRYFNENVKQKISNT